MKKRSALSLALLLALSCTGIHTEDTTYGWTRLDQPRGPQLGYSELPVLTLRGRAFKDHNRNGWLDPFEDWRLSPAERAADLVSQLPDSMLLALLSNGFTTNVPGYASMSVSGITYGGKPYAESGAAASDLSDHTRRAVTEDGARQILLAHAESPRVIAEWNNHLQTLCESLPFAIPSCNSSDPRTEILATDEYNAGSGEMGSEWPTPLGLAATFDPEVARRFGETVSREYRALGFGTALSPQADLASDPRWRRVPGTFGECPELVTAMTRAYIDGFQTTPGSQDGWGALSVNCMVKHWPGGGCGEAGRDAHLSIGKYAVYPGDNLEGQIRPFTEGAFRLAGPTGKAAAVMPYYTVPWGRNPSGICVGNSYDAFIVDSLLRRRSGFEGIVCTDWGITSNYNGDPLTTAGKCYGVEHLDVPQRIALIWEAGVDELGGYVGLADKTAAYAILKEYLGERQAAAAIKASAKRVLESFFRIGLFENPYSDVREAVATLTDPALHAAGAEAQRKSIVLLKNHGGVVPLKDGLRVYVPQRHIPGVYSMTGRLKKPAYTGYSIDTAVVAQHYTIVSSPSEADFALVAIGEPVPGTGYSRTEGYLPISLQYTPYMASTARAVSIAGGDLAEASANRSYRGKAVHTENSGDLDLVRDTKALMGERPVVVLASASRAFIPEFEPWADALLLAFGVRSAAYMDVLSGAFPAGGRLPVQMPADMLTVEAQAEDVPMDMDCWRDADGNAYDVGFGLTTAPVPAPPSPCGHPTAELDSPDSRIRAALYASPEGLRYSVTLDGAPLIAPSPIGMTLSDGSTFGQGQPREIVEGPGSLTLRYKGHALELRVEDDGVAWRWKADRRRPYKVLSEQARFRVGERCPLKVSYTHKNGDPFQDDFENVYTSTWLPLWDGSRLGVPPLLAGTPGARMVVAESDVVSYPGMFLGACGDALEGRFPGYPKAEEQGGHNHLQKIVTAREDWIASCDGSARSFPWRVVCIAREDRALAENDLVTRLAPPPEGDFSWVRPGKVAWEWWNGYAIDGDGFTPGVNTPTYKAYIDFAAQHGLEYVILDEGWAQKYADDLFAVVPGIDLPEIIGYGAEKGVGIILWAGYTAFAKDIEKACSHYSALGVKGFKIDFLDRNDQPMQEFMYRAAETAARYRLVVDFHGCPPPDGLQKRFPNILNYEGIFGLEQMRKRRLPDYDMVEFDVTAPFIRFLAGPADYTPGAFLNATRERFVPDKCSPMSQGTRCRQLAEYVVFDAPLQMLCDSPLRYETEPQCAEFLYRVPTVWDETRVLDGSVGQYIVTARRSGSVWYVGALTDWSEREVTVPLPEGSAAEVEAWEDGADAATDATSWQKRRFTVTDGTFNIHLAPGGGWAGIITLAE